MIDDHSSPTVASPEVGQSLYVYGVVRRRDGLTAEPITGVGSSPAPVRAVAHGDLAALVSDVPSTWRAATRADIEAHDRVLSEVIGQTLVPMRFGVILRDDEMVREQLLERHAAQLSALLDRVDGRVQMTVKVFYRDEALLREVLARRPDLKQRSDALEGRPVAATQNERIALGHDVAAAVEEQRALDESELAEPFARLADDVRVEASRSERQALTAQLLIDAKRRPDLDAAVDRLSEDKNARFAFRYVGPLPPYSFCDLTLEPEPWA